MKWQRSNKSNNQNSTAIGLHPMTPTNEPSIHTPVILFLVLELLFYFLLMQPSFLVVNAQIFLLGGGLTLVYWVCLYFNKIQHHQHQCFPVPFFWAFLLVFFFVMSFNVFFGQPVLLLELEAIEVNNAYDNDVFIVYIDEIPSNCYRQQLSSRPMLPASFKKLVLADQRYMTWGHANEFSFPHNRTILTYEVFIICNNYLSSFNVSSFLSNLGPTLRVTPKLKVFRGDLPLLKAHIPANWSQKKDPDQMYVSLFSQTYRDSMRLLYFSIFIWFVSQILICKQKQNKR